MATYTDADLAASSKFVDANLKIRMLQKMYQRAPHLVSWIEYDLRNATHDDYYIPATLTDSCKIIDIRITKTLCELLSCNASKEQDVCVPEEHASYYYVGDNAYDVQCQPACFNTAVKMTYTDDGARAADTPMLNFHNGKCRVLHSGIISWLEKPFYRSDTKFERRVNDMPTGFTRIPSDNPYGGGITYKTNETYCHYYDRNLQEDGSCDETLGEKISHSLLGEALINTIKSSVRILINNNVPFPLPENLPKLPNELKSIHTLNGWKANINKDFKLPDLIDIKPKVPNANRNKRSTIFHNDSDTNDLIYRRRMAELREHFSNYNDDGDENDDNLSDFTRIHMNLPTKRKYFRNNITASKRKKNAI